MLQGSKSNDEFEIETAKLLVRKAEKKMVEAKQMLASSDHQGMTFDINSVRTVVKDMAKARRSFGYIVCMYQGSHRQVA